MICYICGRSSCTQSFHSLAEQERYERVIELFDMGKRDEAIELRERIANGEEVI